MNKRILITGGAGFIGSNLCEKLLNDGHKIICVDNLTYASNYNTIEDLVDNKKIKFYQQDIKSIKYLPEQNEITHIINFAAETHVDNSIRKSDDFIHSNIKGVYNILELVEFLTNEWYRIYQ